MKRDFGHINHNHAPVDGYNPAPHFYSERGHRPDPAQNIYYQRRIQFLVPGLRAESFPELADNPENVSEIGNTALPIFEYKDEIVAAVKENQVTVVVGATGSGKSTQVPQFLFEAGYEVQITQPRRMAAYNVAERMQVELNDSLGKETARDLVGFQTAEKSTVTEDTKITVLTDGIEHARQFNRKTSLEGTVIVSDEVHEWNTNTEVTLAMIKRRIADNPNERYVLMSATVDAHRIANYFASETKTMPPVIEVPGRTFEIESHEKPHSTVVDEVLESVTLAPDQNILVFVPGKQEIEDVIDTVLRRLPPSIKRQAVILPLHAKLPKEQQDKIYGHYKGIKIVVATNVAQTSLTIDDIGVVIDCGLERRIELDDEEVQGLHILPTSQADCDQRKGRTGRTGPGKYVLTRYDIHGEHLPYINRPKYGKAEILRAELSRTVLRTEAGGIDLEELDLFHPVKRESIQSAKNALYRLGAIDETGSITSMGKKMNEFPVRPTSGRMIVEAMQCSPRVRAYVAAIAASIEVGGLPYFSRDTGKAWQALTEETSSDFLAQLDIFIASQDMNDWQLQENDLDVQNITRARELHRKIVFKTDAVVGPLVPPNLADKEQISTAICAGLIDWVYMHAGGGNYELVSQMSDNRLRELSNRSVVHGQKPKIVVGNPYRVEYWKKGMPEVKDIIEGVNVIEDPRILGKVAIDALIHTVPERTEWAAGKLVEVTKQRFNGVIDLGIEETRPAVMTPRNRLIVRQHVLNNPGPAQQELRSIKRAIENLQHYVHKPLRHFTQEAFEALIDQALEDGVLSESYIDDKLRQIALDQNLTFSSFVSDRQLEIIQKKSPDSITISGMEFGLKYARGNPRIVHYNVEQIAELPRHVKLKDGRDVFFFHEKRWYKINELKKHLKKEDKQLNRAAKAAI